MATPTVTTTALPAETGVIPASNGVPDAPFDAVMALLVPANPAGPDTPSANIAAVAIPVVAAPVESPTALPTNPAAVSPLAGPLPAASLPLSAGMVNAVDPADTDLAALMAASAVAGRGVTARAPVPSPTTLLPAAVPAKEGGERATSDLPAAAIMPEDFIGPVQPVMAAMTPVAPPVSEDFIGPVLPPERRQTADALAVTEPVAPVDLESTAAAAEPAAMPLPAEPRAAPGVSSMLLEAEALLQPQDEKPEVEQPLAPAMAVSALSHPQDDPVPAAALDADADVAPLPLAVNAEKAHATPRLVTVLDAASISKPHSVATAKAIAPAVPVHGDVSSEDADAILILAVGSDGDERASAAPEKTREDDAEIATPAADAGQADAVMAVQQPARQPVANRDEIRPAVNDKTDAALPTPAPRVMPVPLDAAMPARDLAMLRMLNAEASAKPASASRDKNAVLGVERTVRVSHPGDVFDGVSASAFMAPAEDDSTVLPQRVRSPLDGLDRIAPPRANSDRVMNTALSQAGIDPRPAAMVRDITVLSGATETQQTNIAAQAAAMAATPVMTAEHTARAAPVVASVAADGRRDTQRDAEIRERQIKQQVTMALRAGSQEVRMQLYPPGLGQIMIRIALDGQKLRLSVKADNSDATDALAQAETGLRDALSRDGFSLAGFDVHDDEQRGRKRRDPQQIIAPVSNHNAGEGDAFSVDMTA